MEFVKSEWPNEVSEFKFIAKPMQTLDMGILVDNNYPNGDEIIEAFDIGLKMLKDSGEYDNILIQNGLDFLIK